MPIYVRDVGMSLVTAINWLFNFVLSVTYAPLQEQLDFDGLFGYYAAWCVLAFVLILLFVPETRNKSLEELDATFAVQTRIRAAHSLRLCRYYVLRYLLFQWNTAKPQLTIELRDPVTKRISFDPQYIQF